MPRKPPRLKPVNGESIGQRLARLRKARGLTQIEMAARLSISQASVSEYERDQFRLNSDLIIRIAHTLNVSADELLGLKPPPKISSVKDHRLAHRMQLIDRLPKRDRDALLRTINAFLSQAA